MTILTAPMASIAAYEYRVVGEALPLIWELQSAGAAGGNQRRELVEGLARASEVLLVVDALLEACVERGWETLADVQEPIDPLAAVVRQRTGLDLEQTMSEHAAWIAANVPPAPPLPPTSPLVELRDKMLNASRALLDSGVAEPMTRWGEELNLAVWSHRIRVAMEGLRAALLRRESGRDERFLAAGRMYAEGRLTVSQAAEVLGKKEWDVVAEFESHHFCRPIDAIALSDEERMSRLAQLRARREQGPRTPDSGRPARNAVASQRIENVDARKWMRAEDE